MASSQAHSLDLHLEGEQWDGVDAIARATSRDRHSVVEEAVEAYLELHRWHVAHIEEGLRQARAGQFATDEQVAKAFRRKP